MGLWFFVEDYGKVTCFYLCFACQGVTRSFFSVWQCVCVWVWRLCLLVESWSQCLAENLDRYHGTLTPPCGIYTPQKKKNLCLSLRHLVLNLPTSSYSTLDGGKHNQGEKVAHFPPLDLENPSEKLCSTCSAFCSSGPFAYLQFINAQASGGIVQQAETGFSLCWTFTVFWISRSLFLL